MYMAKSQNSSDTLEEKAAPEYTPLLLLGTIADTTWRMFVPAVGFTLMGVWLDNQFSVKPWLMFVGIIIGIITAVLLVKKQIAGLRSKP